MATSGKDMADIEGRNEFHRAVALQYDCVTYLLREFLDYKLSTNSMDLKKYLGSCRVHLGKKYITPDQEKLFNSTDPKSNEFDVSMLTLVLLAKCNKGISVTKVEQKCIEKLREHRNTLAHNISGRLKDNKLFVETSNDLMDLSKSLKGTIQNTLKAYIDDLKQRACVRIHSKLEVLKFNTEQLQIILTYKEDNGEVTEEILSGTVLKFNLLKWSEQISRGIDINKMLSQLRKKKVISEKILQRITDEEYENSKTLAFLEYLIKEGSKIEILHCCKILREQDKCMHLADLIEGRNTDGQDTVDEIKKIEEAKLTEVLQRCIHADENGNVACEAVHSYVEEMIDTDLPFTFLNDVMNTTFGCSEKDGRFQGVTLTKATKADCNVNERPDRNVNIAAMSFEEYAEYIGSKFQSIGVSICENITNAIKNEVVQLDLFVELTEEELDELFGYYLHSKPLQFGIKKQLQRLQKTIKSQLKSDSVETEAKYLLREFDKPFHAEYHNSEVRYPLGGNQNVPAHEFIHIENSLLSKYVIVKNTLKFISACLNSRKNGTIHFGIKRTGRNTGQIVGCNVKPIARSVDDLVLNGIYRCFGHLSTSLQRNIVRCTRPAQIIKIIHEDLVVVEIDVVPFDKHLFDTFYTLMFPPCGPQTEIFFLYEEDKSCDIVAVERDRVEATKKELGESLRERQLLDDETLRKYRSSSDLASNLTFELTRGADYITDVFFPVICAGNMKTVDFLNHHGLQDAFQNSFAVFDFGSSTALRKKMEDGNPIYTVKTALDFDSDEKDISFSDKEIPWIYCNGNDDIGIEVFEPNTWTDRRMIPLENVLRYIKTKIPRLRAKIIFLAFEVYGCKDPMVMFAREAFIRIFKHQCIVIGETDDVLEPFENEISRQIGKEKVSEYLFSGLTWFNIAKVFRKTFKESTETVCKLPNSSGTYDEMSHKEKEKWKDINILSMEECINDEKQMQAHERKIKQKEEETRFYKGQQASWWNFYYGHHGERDLFRKLRSSIEKKLTRVDGVMIVETVEVQHEPGAGGSILGRHLIWHFSQLRCTSEPYRCCVVKQITENTVREIEEFRQYNDTNPRPVIILLDDEPDGNMLFQKGLHQLAYKTASPGELFGLVINVSRISLKSDIVQEAVDGQIEVRNSLKHRLTEREKIWFENKYKELENSDVDVNTLIAFNVMRNSFDREYIRSTVDKIMNEVSAKERDVLKVLSLVSTYEIGTLVPHSVFDSLIGMPITTKKSKIGQGKPYGLRQKRGPHSQPPEVLNSKSLSLFVCRSGYELKTRGLRIISQPLAEVILNHIQENQNLSLEDIVSFIIDQVERQSSKESTESKRFVEVVCSLFKTREDSGKGKDGIKDKFSRLIVAFLETQNTVDVKDGIDSVVRVMNKCIDITKDAFVGQQLARFHIIFTKDFNAAEQVICDSIELYPNNSYLLDTYGQVFKTHMEYLKDRNCQHGQKMSNEIAKEVITLAFKALDMFEDGQVTTQMYEKERCNLSCYYMEVRTLVGLLEIFESFDCLTNDNNLLEVLNSPGICVDNSCVGVLNDNGLIDDIVIGGKRQVHAADALRFVEERDYQVKKIYTIYTSEDVLLLSLRERYERFYSSHSLKYQLKFGYGLKPLMKAMKSEDQLLVQLRYREADMNLQKLPSLEYADSRDLLFFISYSFINLLSIDVEIDNRQFRRLLSYSAKLLDTQKDEKRPYLEAFLFYAIFHWPLKGRFIFDNLSSPNSYVSMMDLWEDTYMKNNYLTNREQKRTNKGKTYFALSKDQFGVIDLFEIEMEWREMKEKEGRSRMHVYKDYFWREPFVAEQLERLIGTLDDSGNNISHVVEYPKGNHVFRIKTFYPSAQLRNRQVTFVLGFTWSGLRAFDVVEKGDNSFKNGKSETDNRARESDSAVTDHTQRKTLHSNGEHSNTRKVEVIPPKRSLFSQSDIDKPIYRSKDETKPTDMTSHVVRNKRRQTEEQPNPRRQSEDIFQREKRTFANLSDQPTGQLTFKSGYMTKQKELHRTSNEFRSQREDDTKPLPLSEFPELKKTTSVADNEITKPGLDDIYVRASAKEEHISYEKEVQSSKCARPKQNLDYATVAGRDFTGTKTAERKDIKEETSKASTQGHLDLASDTSYWDQLRKEEEVQSRKCARPKQNLDYATVAGRDFNGTKTAKRKDIKEETSKVSTQGNFDLASETSYWDQLRQEAMSDDWGAIGNKHEALGGLDERPMMRPNQTDESEPSRTELVQKQTKKSKKKKKKTKEKKENICNLEDKPPNTDKQYFDELD